MQYPRCAIALCLCLITLPAIARAATFTVTTLDDTTDTGSLRWAIVSANGAPGPHTIDFAVTGTFLKTLPDALPQIVEEDVTIDGGDGIFLDGDGAAGEGLVLKGANATLRGIFFRNWAELCLLILGDGAVVEGCAFAASGTGIAAVPASASKGTGRLTGLRIGGDTPARRNGFGNLTETGIVLTDVDAATVEGNWFGVMPNGLDPAPMLRGLVATRCAELRIGGATLSQGNLFGAITDTHMTLLQCDDAWIQRNFLGLALNGSTLGDGGDTRGIVVQEGQDIAVGGPLVGNLVAASGTGIALNGVTRGFVQGNLVGVNAAANAARPNDGYGILVSGGSAIRIGGQVEVEGNIVSANGPPTGLKGDVFGGGIYLEGPVSNVAIQGNYIGVEGDGLTLLPNRGPGIAINGDRGTGFEVQDVTIGGDPATQGNIIAGNIGAGIAVFGADASRVAMRGNRIYLNEGGGIVLLDGANADVPAPVVECVDSATVRGRIPGGSGGEVELYLDAFDQGQQWIGSVPVLNGRFELLDTKALKGGDVPGINITALHTDPAGNTSSFSTPVSAAEPAEFPCVPDLIELRLEDTLSTQSGLDITIGYLDPQYGGRGGEFTVVATHPEDVDQIHIQDDLIGTGVLDFVDFVFPATGTESSRAFGSFAFGSPKISRLATTYTVSAEYVSPLGEFGTVRGNGIQATVTWRAPECDILVSPDPPVPGAPATLGVRLVNVMLTEGSAGTLSSDAPAWIDDLPLTMAPDVDTETGVLTFANLVDIPAWDATWNGLYRVDYRAIPAFGFGACTRLLAEGEGEGGTGEGETPIDNPHNADQNADGIITLSELLRVIQFYNSPRYGCDDLGEDGYAPNATNETCTPHASDYNPQDWRITLSELLRLIQFYNSSGYAPCDGSEDGYCPSPTR